jgi:tripartite-type tricarboxylate transporter receptor subunit TctC
MVEVIPGYERDGAFGMLAPAGTPRAILNQISGDMGRVLTAPDVRDRLQAMGFVAVPTTPEEYDKVVRNEIAIFTKVGKLAGLIAN